MVPHAECDGDDARRDPADRLTPAAATALPRIPLVQPRAVGGVSPWRDALGFSAVGPPSTWGTNLDSQRLGRGAIAG